MKDPLQEKGSVRKRRKRSAPRRTRATRLWVLLWSLVVLAGATTVLVAVFMFWLVPQMKEKDASWRRIAAAERKVRVEARFTAPSAEETMAMVQQVLDAPDEAALAGLARFGEIPAAEALAFIRGMEERDGAVADKIWLGSVDHNGLQLEGVELLFTPMEDKAVHRLALFTPDENGKWWMDFDAFARPMAASWEELTATADPAAETSPAGRIRVMFARDNYYNSAFADDTEWIAYALMAPDHYEQRMLGYCKRSSPQHAAMEQILSKWPADIIPRVTVYVTRVEGAENRQFEIKTVVAEDWVIGPRLFEEMLQQGWR